MDLAFVLLIIALVCVSTPIIAIGAIWYLELLKWSPFWNKRFGRPYWRGLIYDSTMKYIGYFVKTQKQVAGKPTLFSNETWGSFARPTRPTQVFIHGLESRCIFRADLTEAGRWSNEHEPLELVFGDDPKTIRNMQESKSIENLVKRKTGTDYTFLLLAILGVVALVIIVLVASGAFD